MNSLSRLGRFSAVGLIATGIHAAILITLINLDVDSGIANLVGFLVAFTASFFGQQALTFKDRLGARKLNTKAAAALLIINSGLAMLLGAVAPAMARPLLPLLPAVTNYILLWVLTGRRFFTTD